MGHVSIVLHIFIFELGQWQWQAVYTVYSIKLLEQKTALLLEMVTRYSTACEQTCSNANYI